MRGGGGKGVTWCCAMFNVRSLRLKAMRTHVLVRTHTRITNTHAHTHTHTHTHTHARTHAYVCMHITHNMRARYPLKPSKGRPSVYSVNIPAARPHTWKWPPWARERTVMASYIYNCSLELRWMCTLNSDVVHK